jgi:2-polyprenyl-6-methoxyphenol hydroxylase-like FAD-dependent oxidoreductase
VGRTVLVSGASIAGPVAAYWLARGGFDVTVVERMPAVRGGLGGHAVGLLGAAVDVVERMGLLPAVEAARTRTESIRFVRPGRRPVDVAVADLVQALAGVRNIEVMRGELAQLLNGAAREHVEYLFGDSITALNDDGAGVDVAFQHAPPRRFDLVVGADGLHSRVRRLAFGPESDFVHHLGPYLAVFTAPNDIGLENWQVWLREGDASAGIYTARDNTELRVNVGFFSEQLDLDHHDADAARRLVAEHTAGLGWQIPHLLESMWDAEDFYFDAMAQVRMDAWTRGRVALLGDAGYCPSPLSGQGTSLALVGAYVLAAELAATEDHRVAFARYDERMRPFVLLNQALATENPGMAAAEESIERAKNAIALPDVTVHR